MPLDAALGAEIVGIDLTQLDDATFNSLHGGVARSRAPGISWSSLRAETSSIWCAASVARDVIEFARAQSRRTHGQSVIQPAARSDRRYQLGRWKAVGILGDGEVVWHSDFSFKERPTAARMLVAMEFLRCELGGNTFFPNCYAAYDALRAIRKKHLAGKRSSRPTSSTPR